MKTNIIAWDPDPETVIRAAGVWVAKVKRACYNVAVLNYSVDLS